MQSTSPALQQFLTPQEKALDTRAYYRSPVWGPGVHLMGKLPFAAKALLICFMFLIPLAWVSWAFFSTQSVAVEFSEKELLGVQYVREVFPVIALAQKLRRDATAAAVSGEAPAALADIRTTLLAARIKLEDVNKRLGGQLNSAKAYAAMQAAMTAANSATGVDVVFAAHSAHIESLIALLQTVTDNSNLTLDPDIDSYYLMDAALFRIPDIVESSGKLRGLGSAAMKAGNATVQQQRVLNDTIPIAEFQLRNMTAGLAKAFANNPRLGKEIDATPTLDNTAVFFALARIAVINGTDYEPQTQARFLELANKAIDAQFELSQRLITELDGVITQRVKTMRLRAWASAMVLAAGLLLSAYFFVSFYLVSSGGLVLISALLICI